ncbi:MAG: hypothetical protein ABI144_04440, partial [Gallionella sp.]
RVYEEAWPVEQRREPEGWETGVAFSLVTFFLAKQKKVTCCRAAPGEVDFDCWRLMLRLRSKSHYYAQHERPKLESSR